MSSSAQLYVGNIQITAPVNTMGTDECGTGHFCAGVIPKACGTWLGQKNLCCYAIIYDLATKGIVDTVSCSNIPELSTETLASIGRIQDGTEQCSPPSGYLFYQEVDASGNQKSLTTKCITLKPNGTAGDGKTGPSDTASAGPSGSPDTTSAQTSAAGTATSAPAATMSDMSSSAAPTTGASTGSTMSGSVLSNTNGGSSTPVTSAGSQTVTDASKSGSTSTAGGATTTTSKPNSAVRKSGSSTLKGLIVGSVMMVMFVGAQI
ncbi:hypothetical protein H072_11067 [Dactylellina haptotyla CBS 200.50]|uniref:Uncharacterized protein n=1 Tax=Dactylellina haptotyla (strain CBS 200.50) TaxID=1284197 RepID=S8A340_DACHA|nr:hypothetical protein H072_11067 [Dactylellina haptotyla CBS 200.50]